MSRTVVTFRSDAFNTTGSKDYFINFECFGDDVLKWMAAEFSKQGIEAHEPGQEDFGWYLNYRLGDSWYCLVVSYRDDPPNSTWIGWVERSVGLIGSILGGRNRNVPPEAAAAIHRVLTGDARIRDIRWHTKRDFDRGDEDKGSPEP